MNEHEIQVGLVALLILNSLVQGLVSTFLWSVMNRQKGQTSFSRFLKWRELSLAMKSYASVGFHCLLLWAVITGDVWESFISRMVIYVAVVTTSLAAIVFSALLAYRLAHSPEQGPQTEQELLDAHNAV